MRYNWTAADSDISFPEGFCAGLSLFSRSFLSLAAWQRQDGLPGSPGVAHSVDSARPDRPFSVYQRKPIRACFPSCSLCHLSVQRLRVSTPSSSSLTHSRLPTNRIPLYKHQTPQPSRQRSPPSRTLGSETRHPRTDKPARVARSVARSPTPFASTAT